MQGVASDKFGIGYSGIGYKTADVRPLPLRREGRRAGSPADAENAYTGEYPLARFLYVYVNTGPGTRARSAARASSSLRRSRKEGQEVVVKDGYLPIPGKIAAEEHAKIEKRRAVAQQRRGPQHNPANAMSTNERTHQAQSYQHAGAPAALSVRIGADLLELAQPSPPAG